MTEQEIQHKYKRRQIGNQPLHKIEILRTGVLHNDRTGNSAQIQKTADRKSAITQNRNFAYRSFA